MISKRVAVGACLLVLSFAALSGGAASPTSAAESAAGPTTLNIRLPLDYPSLDPMVDAVNSIGWAAVKPGYDYLVAIKKDGKGFEPYLATSWTQTPKSITFKVRRDARCTDGHALTPVDMLNSIKRFIFVQKRGGSAANTSVGGLGPGPYHLRASNKQGTLRVSLDKPWRNLMGIFAGLPMICPAGLKALESDPRALETRVYGSGPYTLVSAQHNDKVSYRLRPAWKWGPRGTSSRGMATNLNFRVVIDPTTAANLLVTGGLDIATLAGPDVRRLLSNSSIGYAKAANWVVAGLMFNMRSGRMFENGAGDTLRRAIFTAVDPRAFNAAVYDGRGHITPSIFRKDMQCYDKATERLRAAPSIARAKQILTSGGYTVVNGRLSRAGQPVQKINLLSSTSFFPNGGAYVLSVLRELGFDAELNDLGATYGPTAIGGNFDLYVVNVDGTGLEQVTFSDKFDGFPMFSPDGTKLIFASNRNSASEGETNLFIADWKW